MHQSTDYYKNRMDEETATSVAIALIHVYNYIIRCIHQQLMGIQEDILLLSTIL
jgi:hypothetical protein